MIRGLRRQGYVAPVLARASLARWLLNFLFGLQPHGGWGVLRYLHPGEIANWLAVEDFYLGNAACRGFETGGVHTGYLRPSRR